MGDEADPRPELLPGLRDDRPTSSWVPRPGGTPAPLPERFGRYRIISRLGRGGMGSVYLAEDTQLGRRVALKVPDLGPRDGAEARARFLEEARTAATLDHPYLCPVFDVGEIDGRLYLTMAYIEGRTLAELIRDEGLPQRQVAALVGKLALALQEAHAKRVIHRDLKPANIMIKAAGQRREPVIVDFGLARRDDPEEARLTGTGQVLGTPGYMAPEQVRGALEEIGPACDIYALGVILYELLTGRLPFRGPALAVVGQVLTQAPPPPRAHRPDLDPGLEAICLKAMAKRVGDRYATTGELAAALTDFLRSGSPTTPKSPVPPAAGEAARPIESYSPVGEFLKQLEADAAAPPPGPGPGEIAPPRRSAGSRRPWWRRFGTAWAVGVSLFGLLAAWYAGVSKVRAPAGVIVLESLPKGADVYVDGSRVPVSWPEGGQPARIAIPAGRHGIEVRKDGFQTFGAEVTAKSGGRHPLRVRMESLAGPRPDGGDTSRPGGGPGTGRTDGPARTAAAPEIRGTASPPLDGRVLFFDDFSDPLSGWHRDPHVGYAGNVYYIEATRPGNRSWNCPKGYVPDNAFRIVGRVLGDDGDDRSAWGVVFSREKSVGERGFQVAIDRKGEFRLEPGMWGRGKFSGDLWIGPIVHSAIRPGGDFNELLLIIRGRRLEIFVNAVAVCDPVIFNWDIIPCLPSLALFSTRQGWTRAEFDEVEIKGLPRGAPSPGAPPR